jgi:hypothetical protein
MALIRVDWNPSKSKIRQFGLMLAVFALLVAAFWAWRGHRERALMVGLVGLPLGLLTAALPETLGRLVYKGWMSVSFVISGAMSPVIMGLFYYGVLTPIALLMRLRGRDALRLKRPAGETYWQPLSIPEDKSYFERLF